MSKESQGQKEKGEVMNKPTKWHTAPIPTSNQVDDLSYSQYQILAALS